MTTWPLTSDLSDQIMDEDEWTDLNFGTSTNLDTSDDSLSDLDTDSELQVAIYLSIHLSIYLSCYHYIIIPVKKLKNYLNPWVTF